MPTYPATGITLQVRRYKGTERLITLYTCERGKVEATVRGVGKLTSKLASAAEPLTLSRLLLARGRTFDRVAQCEVVDAHYDLRKDIRRLALASYAAELVAQTTEVGQPEPEVFYALRDTLAVLTTTTQPELVAWAFALRYLHLHGTGPVLDRCVSCGCDLQDTVWYVAPLGGCVCQHCASSAAEAMQVSPETRSAARGLMHLPPERLDRLRLTAAVRSQLHDLLQRHIRHHLAVVLKSEAFLEKMGGAGANQPRGHGGSP